MATLAQVTTALGLVTTDVAAIVTANGTDTTGLSQVGLFQQAFSDLQAAQDLLTQVVQTQTETDAVTDPTAAIDAAADASNASNSN